MGMEMRQELKLSQQLVMTPQLQQAIRLLQLSRMELADLVHEEMLENPILDDELDLENERSRERDEMGGDEQQLHQMEGAGSTETAIEGSVVDGVAQTEIKGDAAAVNEIDWENYLDNYTMGPPMPAFRGDGEELPSLEATLTKPPSLHDHLAWQLKMITPPLSPEQLEIGMTILGNIDADGYFKDPPLTELAADLGYDETLCEDPDVRSDRRRRAQPRRVHADPGDGVRAGRRPRRQDDPQPPRQPREEELPGDRARSEAAARRDLRGREGHHGLRSAARPAVQL
jgi:DNA-directed RNA polymerase specialized sigma54-like protein